MSKDPAFLFYPGDYLRDTQILSESAQVAYDRLMCEHMRNICTDMSNIVVSKEQVNFITKRLSEDERAEIFHVLTKVGNDYQIYWVAESISKRKAYSESRSKNRSSKPLKKQKKTSSTYVEHMEIENEDVNKDSSLSKKGVSQKKPTYEEFSNHAFEKAGELNIEIDEVLLKTKFLAWSGNNWHTLGKNSSEIKNWKSTLTNSLKYLQKEKSSGKKENELSHTARLAAALKPE